MRDVFLEKRLVEVPDRNIKSGGGDNGAVVHRVFPRVRESDTLIVRLEIRKLQTGDEFHSVEGSLKRPFEPCPEFKQVPPLRNFPETSNANGNRMHGSAANNRHDLVADFLQFQSSPQQLRLFDA